MSRRRVEQTQEFLRIQALPRRAPQISEDLVQRLTETLRAPTGSMSLRPVQALALHDIGTVGGLTAPIRVGGGKTLISLLAPHVLGARRPLLLLPAGLVQKTEMDRRQLAQHWVIPRHIRIMSYESLGRVSAAKELDLYHPDLIIADEAHRLKNRRASCTRRVLRYLNTNPETQVLIMSGTLIKHSIKDFAPLTAFSLKEGSPVPREWSEQDDWSDALDEKVNPLSRVLPGALGSSLPAAREWFHRRLVETPGVVSSGGDSVSCSLRIQGLTHQVSQTTEDNFAILRERWETPDGWAFSMATDLWRHARELALGLHYIWQPRAPEDWLGARRAWAKFVRETIKNSGHGKHPLDSELQVTNAVDGGHIEDLGLLRAWREIKPTFQVNSKPVWHDDSALKACSEWMDGHKGIVWVEHNFFAKELSRRTGAPYFGPGGLDSKGRPISEQDGSSPIIASVAANATGRNLQMFHANLITCPSAGADAWEQLMGRTHRDGQEADEVTFDVLCTCAEHIDSMQKAMKDAKMHQEILGQPQKLLLADNTYPMAQTSQGIRWT